jgi:hypothetical protein
VNAHFDEAATESLEDKILRMMKNDLTNGGKSSKMVAPQADWLPERGRTTSGNQCATTHQTLTYCISDFRVTMGATKRK